MWSLSVSVCVFCRVASRYLSFQTPNFLCGLQAPPSLFPPVIISHHQLSISEIGQKKTIIISFSQIVYNLGEMLLFYFDMLMQHSQGAQLLLEHRDPLIDGSSYNA